MSGKLEGRQPTATTTGGDGVSLPVQPAVEGFATNQSGEVTYQAAGFDAAAYRRENPDVAAVIPNDPAQLAAHWRESGFFEGRRVYGLQPYADRVVGSGLLLRRPSITCFGFFDAATGLGAAARLYRDAFVRAGYDIDSVTVRERNGRLLTQPDAKDHRSTANQTRINFFILNADMMNLFFLDGREHFLNNAYNIAVWYWELSFFRPEWSSSFGGLDEIWVASEFCRRAVATLSPIPVLVIPPPVLDVSGKPELPREHFGIAEGTFVFASIFDIGSATERKNPLSVIKAFRSTFEGRDDCCLVLKFHGVQNNPAAVKALHAAATGVSNIRFFGAVMNDAEMASLRSIINCLVSPHRAEGFGFNLAEMLLLGRPVIATDYSGTQDFLTSETGFPIPFGLCRVGENAAPYPPEAIWAEPDQEELARAMKAVVDDPKAAQLRADRGRASVRQLYGLDACAQRIKARLGEIGVLESNVLPPSTWGAGRPVSTPGRSEVGVRISFLAVVDNTPPAFIVACVNSVLRQTYQNWELILTDVGSKSRSTQAALEAIRGKNAKIRVLGSSEVTEAAKAITSAVEFTSGEVLFLLRADDEISPDAAANFAAAAEEPGADLIYGDEDVIDLSGEHISPHFKPDWSPEHLEATMYLGYGVAIRRLFFLALGGVRAVGEALYYDLVLRASRRAKAIIHVPGIAYHRRDVQGPRGTGRHTEDPFMWVLRDHLAASGRDATVEAGFVPNTFRVRESLPERLPVTIVVFTNNGSANVANRGRINLFDHLVTSIEDKTKTRCEIRILAVDNGNLTAMQRERVNRGGGRVVSFELEPSRSFNFAKKANFAFRHVDTEYVVMMNDDMEVITPGWLDALLEIVIRPTVGTVGAKLLFPDDTIQHCGVVLGIFEDAAHIYHRFPASEVGYFANNEIIRNYSALTGACLATKMSVFHQVNGFDESLAIDYNDIDLGLRILQQGYRNVFTPFATLYHFEGQTAKRNAVTMSDQMHFKARWSDIISRDPHYNQNLTRRNVDFAPASP